MCWRSRYSWITESYFVLNWLSLLRRCSVLRNCDNAEDLEWPRADFPFSGSRKGRLTTYLPLSYLQVVRRKFSSHVKSEDFVTFTGRFSTSQNLVRSLSRDVSTEWEIRVEKTEIWFSLGAGTGPVRIHPKTVSWPRREPQMFGRVPIRRMDGSTSAPTKISICALS